MRSRGWHVAVAALSTSGLTDDLERDGLEVHGDLGGLPAKAGRTLRSRLRALSRWVVMALPCAPLTRTLLDLARRPRSSTGVIHVRAPDLLVVAGMVGRLSSRTVVWQIPNFQSRSSPYLALRRYLFYFPVVRLFRIVPIANSEATAAHFAFLGRAVRWAYVPVSTPEEPAEPIVEPLNRPLRLLSLGRVSPTKGQIELVDAYAKYRDLGGTATLRIVGLDGGQHSADVRRRVEELGVAHAVELRPVTKHPSGELKWSDVVIVGQTEFEPFGQVAALAMLMGRPIVAIGEGGPAEMVRKSGSGWHGPSWQPAALARTLLDVESDREGLAQMSQQSLAFARRSFDPARFLDTYAANVVGAPGRGLNRPPPANRLGRRFELDARRSLASLLRRPSVRAVYTRTGGLWVRRRWHRFALERAGEVVVNEAGVRLHVLASDQRAVRLRMARGALDRPVVDLWRSLVTSERPTIIIDIGANYGEVALSCRYDGAVRAIHLIEANTRLAACLQATRDGLSRGFPPVFVHGVAASDADGSGVLYVDRRSSGLSSLVSHSGDPQPIQEKRLEDEVTIVPDDRLLFKIDVEGGEAAALRGMGALLRTRSACGICEIVHASPPDLEYIHAAFTVSVVTHELEEVPVSLARHLRILEARGLGRRDYLKDVVLRPRSLK